MGQKNVGKIWMKIKLRYIGLSKNPWLCARAGLVTYQMKGLTTVAGSIDGQSVPAARGPCDETPVVTPVSVPSVTIKCSSQVSILYYLCYYSSNVTPRSLNIPLPMILQ